MTKLHAFAAVLVLIGLMVTGVGLGLLAGVAGVVMYVGVLCVITGVALAMDAHSAPVNDEVTDEPR